MGTPANHNNPSAAVSVGARIAVYWPLMATFYPGTVRCIHDRHVHVFYDDGDDERLLLANESWHFLTGQTPAETDAPQPRAPVQPTQPANHSTDAHSLPAVTNTTKPAKPRKPTRKSTTAPPARPLTPAKRPIPPPKRPAKTPKLAPPTKKPSPAPPPPARPSSGLPTAPPRKPPAAKTVPAVTKTPDQVRQSGRPAAASPKKKVGRPKTPAAGKSGQKPASGVSGSIKHVAKASKASKKAAPAASGDASSLRPKAPAESTPAAQAEKPGHPQNAGPSTRPVPDKQPLKEPVPSRTPVPGVASATPRPPAKQAKAPATIPPPSKSESNHVQPRAAPIIPRAPVSTSATAPVRQLARPIISGVPLSGRSGPSAAFMTAAAQSAVMGTAPPREPQDMLTKISEHIEDRWGEAIKEVVRPLVASCSQQLNSQIARISGIADTLSVLTHRLSDIEDRCKVLRADVDNMESEATSRAEMNKLLSQGYAKHMAQLQEAQANILVAMKDDLRNFVKEEIKGIEEKLMSEFKKKSVEVFSKLFEGAVNSIDEKDVLEDSTSPSKNISSHTGRVRRIIDECERQGRKGRVIRRAAAGEQVTETGGKVAKGDA